MTEKKNLGKRLKRFIPLYLMMIPGAVYLIINNYIPMTGIVIAFKQFNYGKGIWGSPFIGFKNFEFLFATKDAWIITRNTLLYNVAFIVLGTACASPWRSFSTRSTPAPPKKSIRPLFWSPF